MSSIRVFLLAALAQRGPMHGHQVRLLAEQEHVHLWTDITVGAVYGALKRLASEDLIEEIRIERHGSYPPRQVWAITNAGREALGGLRLRGLREIVIRPDPVDLAMTRLDPDRLDDLPAIISARLAALSALLAEEAAHTAAIASYLTVAETVVRAHRAARLRADVAWHEELLGRLPEIITDERQRGATT